VNSVQTRSAERALSGGTWLIVCGAMLYSILTVTPLMSAHTADKWDWTAPILPLVVDAAVVIVVKLDDVLARLGGHGGRWPLILRWMTGLMTLALNTADSALKKDLVGVAVHAVAPLLLIVTAETSLAYRRAIAHAVAALEAEQQAERERREQVARERAEQARAQAREEREHAAMLAREQREHEAALAREAAEREERQRREEREARERAEAAERELRERREREREQREHEAEIRERQARERAESERRALAEQAERERREREQRTERERAALLERGPAASKLPEGEARQIVAAAFAAGLSVRQAAELCGWSVGWVSQRYADHRDPAAGTRAELAIASQ
jgi:multidrug efflux pump subunit AcrB